MHAVPSDNPGTPNIKAAMHNSVYTSCAAYFIWRTVIKTFLY